MQTVLVTGASRGLGLEFVRQYAPAAQVIACCRNPGRAVELAGVAARFPGRVRVEALDVTDHPAIRALAAKLRDSPIDVLINNAGVIGPRDPDGTRLPEQLFGTINYTEWQRVIDVNVFGPTRVAEAFCEHVAASREQKMVFVSSTIGSNIEGEYAVFAYSSSKAMLNKVVTMLARALRERGIICAAVCPGHAKTELGGPGARVEVSDSISGLRRVIAGLTLERTGSFTRYDGTPIAW
jgi:NAD(P)-dependent dehydrogenase (short-subunit alcohol dehydrogenase family)